MGGRAAYRPAHGQSNTRGEIRPGEAGAGMDGEKEVREVCGEGAES